MDNGFDPAMLFTQRKRLIMIWTEIIDVIQTLALVFIALNLWTISGTLRKR